MIHTHVYIQKPYLLWFRYIHTLKFLHVFKIHNNIAHNIKGDTFQSDILQGLLGVITYVHKRIEEKQTRAPSGRGAQSWHSKNENGRHEQKCDGENKKVESRCTMYSVRIKSVTMQARPMSQFKCRDHKL